MIDLKAGNISWIEKWGIPIVKFWIKESNEFCKNFEKEIVLLKKLDFSKYATGSFFWKYKNMSFFKYKELSLPLIKIKYEEFVHNPKPFLESIMKLLDLKWEEHR